MNLRLWRLAAVMPIVGTLVAFIPTAPAKAETVDATDFVSANYDFTGIITPPFLYLGVAFYADYVSPATTGSCSVSNSSCFEIDFFDSANNLLFSNTSGSIGPGSTAVFADSDGLFPDPMGRVVISSLDGSALDVLSLFVFGSTSAQHNIDVGQNVSDALVSFNETPLPAALPLFATGLGALGLLGWRRKRKGAAIAA